MLQKPCQKCNFHAQTYMNGMYLFTNGKPLQFIRKFGYLNSSSNYKTKQSINHEKYSTNSTILHQLTALLKA